MSLMLRLKWKLNANKRDPPVFYWVAIDDPLCFLTHPSIEWRRLIHTVPIGRSFSTKVEEAPSISWAPLEIEGLETFNGS